MSQRREWSTTRVRWIGAAGLVVVAVTGSLLVAAAPWSAAPHGSIACDATEVVYGTPVGCTVDASTGAELHWGDGARSPAIAGTHVHATVGDLTVDVVLDDTVLASHRVAVMPDLVIDCAYGLDFPVYELTASDPGSVQPYDYVYLTEDGRRLRPGDEGYPATIAEVLAAERSVVEEASIVGPCRSESVAADDLEATVTWTIDSAWHPTQTFRSRHATPGTPGKWDGVQPIEVTVTVDIDGHTASERIGVYFGGCG